LKVYFVAVREFILVYFDSKLTVMICLLQK